MVARFKNQPQLPALADLDCPVPQEVSCGSFDDPVSLTRHLLDEHTPWETAQLAARLAIELEVLVWHVGDNLADVADACGEAWFPTAYTTKEEHGYEGLINGLVPLTDTEQKAPKEGR